MEEIMNLDNKFEELNSDEAMAIDGGILGCLLVGLVIAKVVAAAICVPKICVPVVCAPKICAPCVLFRP